MTAARVLDLARTAGLTVSAAESCTGGMVAAALTDLPGSSEMFLAGVVAYSNAAKSALLGVPAELIAGAGAVSEEVAAAMAEGMRVRTPSDIAVSITGIAGPGGSEHKPEGRVCFGLARAGASTLTSTAEFGAIGRGRVRAAARDRALSLLLDALRTPPTGGRDDESPPSRGLSDDSVNSGAEGSVHRLPSFPAPVGGERK